MGRAKEKLMELEEKPYCPTDKVVCNECVKDKILKRAFKGKWEKRICDYCNFEAKCIPVNDLIENILEGIFFEYDYAANGLAWDEGEYVGDFLDTYDLLHKLSGDIDVKDNLFEDIIEIIKPDSWCRKCFYGAEENEEQLTLWGLFSKMVRTRIRYVFLDYPKEKLDYYEKRYKKPSIILNYITNKAKSIGLFSYIEENTKIYRGRVHKAREKLNGAKDLGSPPNKKAKDNRMSAKGISIFYGADGIETTIREIYDDNFPCVTVAPFINLRKLVVLDLTKIDNVEFPSLFDKYKRENREAILFFRKLKKILTKPIKNMKSIEYIPIQIIAEYFRYICKYEGNNIDGIIYNSSKKSDGKCYALFFDYEQCLEYSNQISWKSSEKKQELKIIEEEIKTYMVCRKTEQQNNNSRFDDFFKGSASELIIKEIRES